MLAVVVFAARWGQPSRLLYGVDYELNVCGVNNALHTDQLRFTSVRATRFPYEVLPQTAGVAMDVDPDIAAALKALQIQIGERDFAPSDGRWWAPGRGSRLRQISPAFVGRCSRRRSPQRVHVAMFLEFVALFLRTRAIISGCVPVKSN